MVPAVKLGAAFWTGRRTGADDIADTIAVTAGLPVLPPREELISRRLALIMLPIAIVLLVLAAVLGAARIPVAWSRQPVNGFVKC